MTANGPGSKRASEGRKSSSRGRRAKHSASTPAASPAAAGAPPTAPPLRILVVEDHPDTRQGLEVFLEVLGHRVRFATDMHTALAAAAEEEFDLLLSDISLSDGDGWELVRRLKTQGRLPPRAVAMSGLGSTADLTKSRQAGFHTHLVKPFLPEELEAVLQETQAALATRKLPRTAAAARGKKPPSP